MYFILIFLLTLLLWYLYTVYVHAKYLYFISTCLTFDSNLWQVKHTCQRSRFGLYFRDKFIKQSMSYICMHRIVNTKGDSVDQVQQDTFNWLQSVLCFCFSWMNMVKNLLSWILLHLTAHWSFYGVVDGTASWYHQ